MPALAQWLPPSGTPLKPPPTPHATLQHLLHNLCCDWQASINLARLCSIIISPAIQLDSAQQASWHCEASQRKFPVSRQGGWLLLQWIFYGGTCQYNAEYYATDKHALSHGWCCVKRMLIQKEECFILRPRFTHVGMCVFLFPRNSVGMRRWLVATGVSLKKIIKGCLLITMRLLHTGVTLLFTNMMVGLSVTCSTCTKMQSVSTYTGKVTWNELCITAS